MSVRLFLFSFLACCFSVAGAKPVLTAANMSFRNGDHINYYIADSMSLGTGGPSTTWNFSTVNSKSTFTGYVNPCRTSINCQYFPGSNTVITTPQVEYFFTNNSDSLTLSGVYYYHSNNKAEVYSDPQRLMTFPFTYGSKYVDSFRSVQISAPVTLTHAGSDSTEADGWGTIITRSGSISNVLRVKKILTFRDVYDTGKTWFTTHSRVVSYFWYQPDYYEYLFSVSTTYTDEPGKSAISSQTVYTGITNNTPNLIQEPDQGILLLENPAKSAIRFTLNQQSVNVVNFCVRDVQGRTMTTGCELPNSGKSIISIPTAGWVPGLYFLTVSGVGGTASRRVIVE